MRLITSRQNETFRFLKALTEPHTRKKHRSFLLEGATFVAEALEGAETPVLLVALTHQFAETERGQKIVAAAQGRRVPVVVMEAALFDEIVPSETPQGVLAVLREPSTEGWTKLTFPLTAQVLVLESVQDPSNVGAIVRVADAAGAAAVFYTKGTADPYAPKAVRASAGSLLHLPVLPVSSVAGIVAWLKERSFQIVATVPEGGVNLFAAPFASKVAILVGNEARGLSAEARQVADLQVTIPMPGKAPSLNVAVATAVVLYELVRRSQRWTPNGSAPTSQQR